MSDEMMFKGIADRINKGDSSITEREISLSMYYELRSLNDKLKTLDDKYAVSIIAVAERNKELDTKLSTNTKRVDDLEDFRIEYTSYMKLIPGASLLISLITGIIVLWKSLTS